MWKLCREVVSYLIKWSDEDIQKIYKRQKPVWRNSIFLYFSSKLIYLPRLGNRQFPHVTRPHISDLRIVEIVEHWRWDMKTAFIYILISTQIFLFNSGECFRLRYLFSNILLKNTTFYFLFSFYTWIHSLNLVSSLLVNYRERL